MKLLATTRGSSQQPGHHFWKEMAVEFFTVGEISLKLNNSQQNNSEGINSTTGKREKDSFLTLE